MAALTGTAVDTRSRVGGAPANAAVAGATPAALDLHEGISTPTARERPSKAGFEDDSGPSGCSRWPETMRLLSSNGELVRGRCRSTNQCAYCARLAAVENAELLALDALDGCAPSLWAVLTTSRPTRDPAAFYLAREKVIKALRRRWPECEYAALVEFTTGYAATSGGLRRPHWNLLLKGIPAEDAPAAEALIRAVWCGRSDVEAKPEAQYVGTIKEVGGLLRYVALHFQKESQAPPAGWRGHRFLKSRGYLSTPTPAARERAREALAYKRDLWRAINAGHTAQGAQLHADQAAQVRAVTEWALVEVGHADRAGKLQPVGGPKEPRRRDVDVLRAQGIGFGLQAQRAGEWLAVIQRLVIDGAVELPVIIAQTWRELYEAGPEP